MNVNELPPYDASDNPTGCCPRFNPRGWDGQELHLDEKPFVRVMTRSFLHMPLNMGRVFKRAFEAIERAGAFNPGQMMVLSRELSPWSAEHFIAVGRDVPGADMHRLSGDYMTKVFEGPYRAAPGWMREMEALVKRAGRHVKRQYLYYTTCPRCAKQHGKNYVVAIAEVG